MNLKRVLSFLKYPLLVAVVLATVGIQGCDNGDDGPTIYDGTVLALLQDAKYHQTVAGNTEAALGLDSLKKYLELYPSLTALLSGSNEVTLFAPSNLAFQNLIATPGFPANIKQINPDIIAGVLAFHIVNGRQLKADLDAGATFTTNYPAAVDGDEIIVNDDGTLETGSVNKEIEITTADQQANNGVIHIVESVMIPQSVGNTLTPILGTTAGTVLLGKDFSYLAYMIGYADAGVEVANRVSSILASPNNVTVFAPANAVFEGAWKQANSSTATPTKEQVQAFIQAAWTGGGTGTAAATLKNHIVAGKYTVDNVSGSTQFQNNTQLTSVLGVTLTVFVMTPTNQVPHGVMIQSPSANPSNAPIFVKDLAHNNGIVHVVGGILKPQ